ncbi:MAG: DUF945 family protein [Motiliproteus sp.]
MKKLLFGTAIGLIAVAAFSSYMGHTLTQQSFDRQVETLRKLGPDYRLSVEEADLTQRLFDGDAKISLFFDSPDPQLPSLSLVLQSTLQYGPLLRTDSGIKLGFVAGRSHLSVQGLPEADAKKLQALIGPHLLSADHWVDFSRQLFVDFQSPGFEINEQKQSLAFAGIQAQVRTDLDNNHTTGELNLGRFSLNTPDGHLQVATSKVSFESADIRNYMAPGWFELSFPQIDIQESGSSFSLKNASITVAQSLEDGKINITETINLAEIISPLPISSANASFAFNQINPQGITLWGDILSQLDAIDPNAVLSEISAQQSRELISALLQPGLQFNQSYQLQTAQGSLLASLDIEYKGLADGLHPMDAGDPSLFLNALNAELHVTADQPAIMALPIAPMVSTYVDQGLLVEGQQKLRIHALLRNGELSVNGKPFPLDNWL